MKRRTRLAFGLVELLVAGMVTLLLEASLARGADVGLTQVGVTAGIGDTIVTRRGQKFYKAHFLFFYTGSGTILLSGNADGTGDTLVDDVVTIKVRKHTFTHDYSNNCVPLASLPPQDLTPLFTPGLNKVTVTFRDKCSGIVFATPIWLTTIPPE